MRTSSLPPETGRLQKQVRALVRPLIRAAFHLEVSGEENVPRSGPAILAPNHDSMWDVPVLVVASPRRVVFMAHRDVFATSWKRWLFTELGGFPVSSGAGAIRSAAEVLRAGRLLGLFPEGTRVASELGEFRPGAARLALSLGVPIVPVGISGTGDIMPAGSVLPRPARVKVSFGDPLDVPRAEGQAARKRKVPELTEELRDRVRRLLYQ